MEFLIALFWIGLIITFGAFVFQIVVGLVMYVALGIGATIYWAFCKLTGRDF